MNRIKLLYANNSLHIIKTKVIDWKTKQIEVLRLLEEGSDKKFVNLFGSFTDYEGSLKRVSVEDSGSPLSAGSWFTIPGRGILGSQYKYDYKAKGGYFTLKKSLTLQRVLKKILVSFLRCGYRLVLGLLTKLNAH